MKKSICFTALLLICLSLFGCAETYHGTDALIEKAREVFPIAEAGTTEIQYAGMCGKDDKALVWFVSGNEFQLHTYLPMEVTVIGKDEYRFERTCKPMDRGTDISVLQWENGYAFLINDPNCKAVRFTDDSGTTVESLEKDAYPYVFYHSTIPTEYSFLDADGNEIG